MITWREPAVPRHVIQMFVMDENGFCLFFHRSPIVRSAANVWSIPSGLQEIGESIGQTIQRELDEEFSLTPVGAVLLGQYENIAGDDPEAEQYHWVISMYGIIVESLNMCINNEPEKHDMVIYTHKDELTNEWWNDHQFHPSLNDFIRENYEYWINKIENL